MRIIHSAPFPRRWPLLGLAALLVILIAALTLVWTRTGPASAQDDYADQQLIDTAWGYAAETDEEIS